MNAAQANGTSGNNQQSTGIRFVEQFLAQTPQGRLTGLLLGQLDAFNRITTTFGHAQCDVFCATYTGRLRRVLPPKTPILRLSDRRFAVLLSADAMSAVMDAAIRITEEDPPQLEVSGDRFLVDVTLGIAVYPSHADDASTLFRRAELALKEARASELAFEIYRPDATQQQAALWKFETDLKEAVENNELEVYFQPKVAIKERRVCGVEALVRWRMQSGRFVPATAFIPLAERTGSIVGITWLVFDRIVEWLKDWDSVMPPFSIAVNVPPQVLTHSEFLSRLRNLKGVLDGRGFSLTIELTEDSLVQSDATSIASIDRLRKLGIDLSIDDFGKGYSSLSYLKQIPATEIKIDKRFISAIATDKKDQHIVQSVIALAHAFGMRVVAEGVDSAESLSVISKLGCEMAQGFFLARPMRGDLLPDWINNYSSTATSTKVSVAEIWLTAAARATPPLLD